MPKFKVRIDAVFLKEVEADDAKAAREIANDEWTMEDYLDTSELLVFNEAGVTIAEDDDVEEPELPELPSPWRVQREANGRYAAFYGDGARREGFYSPETAAQWVLDYLNDAGGA